MNEGNNHGLAYIAAAQVIVPTLCGLIWGLAGFVLSLLPTAIFAAFVASFIYDTDWGLE